MNKFPQRKTKHIRIIHLTPDEFFLSKSKLKIKYSIFKSQFGKCLIASTDRGICNVLFFENKKDILDDMKIMWPHAHITEDHQQEHKDAQEFILSGSQSLPITLHLYGTVFEIRVWKELLKINFGKTSNYKSITHKISKPNFSRVVARAISKNPVGFIIPCHRVIRSNGEISGYRWGVERKKAMLLHEASLSSTHAIRD